MARIVKVFAFVGLLATLAVVVAGVMTVSMIRRGFSARDQPSTIEATLASMMRSWSMTARAATLKSPIQPSPGILRDARSHWADHCAICHANDGSGDTQIGRNLYPRAPDMRGSATQNLTDGKLYFIVENGVRLTGMPAWGNGREDSLDSWQLVAFIRHLPALTKEEEAEMRKMNPVSPGERSEEKEEEDFLRGTDGATSHPSRNDHSH